MGEAGRAVIAVVSSVIGLAILSVILSARANTAGVIQAGGQALSGVLGAATAPVTGASVSSLPSVPGLSSTPFGNLPWGY